MAEQVLTAEQVGPEIAAWLADAVYKLGKNQLDESVLVVTCRGGMFKFTAQVYRPLNPKRSPIGWNRWGSLGKGEFRPR